MLLTSCKNNYLLTGSFPHLKSDSVVLVFDGSHYDHDNEADYIQSFRFIDTVLLNSKRELLYKNDKIKNTFATVSIGVINGKTLAYEVDDKSLLVNPIFDFSKTPTKIRTVLDRMYPETVRLEFTAGGEQFEIQKNLLSRQDFITKISTYKDTINHRFIPPYNNSYSVLNNFYSEYSSISSHVALSYFNSLSKKMRQSDKGKIILRQIIAKKDMSKKSSLLVNAVMEDKEEKKVAFKSLLSEKPYTLVIYGASWCRPCRMNVPEYKSAYKKINQKATFVSISIDTFREEWVKSVNEDNIPWQSLIATPDFLKAKFEIYGIPYYMLLNQDGEIVANGEDLSAIIKLISDKI